MEDGFHQDQERLLPRANGGYLVLNALDVFIEPGVWIALKRTLRNRTMEMQSFDPFYLFASSALKPEPIDVKVKVVMIGDAYLYETVYAVDEDFKKIFKIKADFDTVMERKDETQMKYAAFIRKICSDEKLLPFDRSGVAAVIEYGVRLAGRQKKLSTEFHRITDILREANYWAKKDGSATVTEKHVDQAIAEKIYRKKMIEEKIQEMIDDGIILIDSDGAKVGQVNGLSVYDLGEYAFGKPSRITAKTSMGKAGIINIEREADLSGRTHNKGVLILGGYLRGKYAQDKPLTLTASICFRTVLRGNRRGQRLLHGSVCHPLQPGGVAHPAGHGRDRVGEPERRNPADRGRQPEDRGFFRCLQSQGVDRDPGGHDSRTRTSAT